MNISSLIKQMIDDYMKQVGLMDIRLGTVSSIEPLKITLMDGMLELNENNLILTESVIRKEIRIKTHKHLFEKDHFKHNHGSPLKGELGQVVINVTGQASYNPAGSKVELQEGSKDKDLSGDEFETLFLPKPTEDFLEVTVNGKLIPLSKDPEDDKEEDEDESPVMWGVLNHGLHKDDKVLLLECKESTVWVVLSKVYDTYYYREDE